MLGTTLWFTIAIGLIATVLLDAAATFGRAGLHAAADHAIESAMHDALADYQNQLQAAIAANAPAALATTQPFAGAPPSQNGYASALGTLPNPLTRTLTPDEHGTGPRFTLTYAVIPTTIVAPSCAAASASQPDTIAWLQCSGFVQESRMSLRVDVDVLDPAGAQHIATRTRYVTLRLFAEPPYSAIVGSKDASAAEPAAPDADSTPSHEGDVGGDTVSGATPAPQSGSPVGGTLIHVQYECHDGAGHCANAAPPDPDAGLHSGVTWENGNRPTP